MFRHFQIQSDTLTYAGGKATASFTRKTNLRALLIGQQFICSDEKIAAQNLQSSLKIGSREIMQGEAVPVALISDVTAPPVKITDNSTGTATAAVPAVLTASEAGTPEGVGTLVDVTAAFSQSILNNNFATVDQTLQALRNAVASLAACLFKETVERISTYYPGTAVRLVDGQAVGAIPVNPDQKIEMDFEDLTAGSAEGDSVILHFLEIPEDCDTSPEANVARGIWEQVSNGVGSISIHGAKKAYTAAVAETLKLTPKATGEAMRQLEVRGLTLDNSNEPAESDFANVTIALKTSTEESPQGDPIHARAVVGTQAKPRIGSALLDLLPDDSSLIKLVAPAPASGTRTVYFASMLEGRGQKQKQLTAAKAAS